MKSLIFLALLLPGAVFAATKEEEDWQIPILETAQEILGVKANALANRLDSFFATERADDELGRSRIRVRTSYEIRERAMGNQDTDYRINLRLPSLEERFRYSFKSEQKKKEDGKVTVEEVKDKIRKNRILKEWIFNADAGINVSIPPKIITRARARRNFQTGTLIHRFSEEVTYTTDESGLVEETELNSDQRMGENLLFRFVNIKTWEVLQKDFRTAHGPTLLHSVSDNDAFSYAFTMASIIDDGIWYVNNYRLSVNYRRNLYKHWLYLDLIPGIDFPKQWSFRRTPFVMAQLEFLFGG